MRGRKTGGRLKGTPNKMTGAVREAIEKAFDGMGGVDALTAWAKEHPTEFYSRIWPKLLPLQIAGDADKPAAFTIQWASEANLAREILARHLAEIRDRSGGPDDLGSNLMDASEGPRRIGV